MKARATGGILVDRAEGRCHGLPYSTELASSQGCSIHFWVGDNYDADLVSKALDAARGSRDIVYASWSLGQPTGFWANQDIK